jgi:hypothetical protein
MTRATYQPRIVGRNENNLCMWTTWKKIQGVPEITHKSYSTTLA